MYALYVPHPEVKESLRNSGYTNALQCVVDSSSDSSSSAAPQSCKISALGLFAVFELWFS